MVRISCPPAIAASTVHDFTGSPSIQTTQVPQLLVSQPQWVPVNAEVVAQEVHQQQPALDLPGDLFVVDDHRDLHAHLMVSVTRRTARRRARLVSSTARCRLYSSLPRASVTGLQFSAARAPACA